MKTASLASLLTASAIYAVILNAFAGGLCAPEGPQELSWTFWVTSIAVSQLILFAVMKLDPDRWGARAYVEASFFGILVGTVAATPLFAFACAAVT